MKSGKPLENVTIKSKDFSLKTSAAGLAIYTRSGKTNYNVYSTLQLSTATDTLTINKTT
jgi:hypothetical protein